MSAFGTLAGSAVAGSIANTASAPKSSEQRSTSMIASMFGLSAFSSSASSSQRETQAATNDSIPEEKIKPSWMVEVRYILLIGFLFEFHSRILPYLDLMLTDGSHGRRIWFDLCCMPRRQNSPTHRVTWALCIHEESHNSI